MEETNLVQKFITWTKLKIRIHISEKKLYPREREIWWVSLGQNIGVEVNGKNKRFEGPVLVLKRYHDDACLVLPLSSKVKTGSYYFSFKNQNGMTAVANFSQTRSISTKRFIRMIGRMNVENFEEVRHKFKMLI